ncbi:MAG: dihydrolipoyl dehydrogenase [Saprospiraceae bacterium]|nr:dihydrolipoyl dehydrogenase [Saprospiraceae bacterium]
MKYDLTIIGSGPGGYVAAIRAAQLGMKTALIEKYDALGGTCLNVGCIPSKALLDSSEHYHNAQHQFSNHGIKLEKLSVDLERMIARKGEVVSQTVQGVNFLMKKNKVDVMHGHGSFVDIHTIAIEDHSGKVKKIETKKTIIATGSKPITPDAFNYDKKRVITSTEALTLSKLPKTMVIIGGGVIGLELGSVYARLGTKVEVVEYLDRIIPGMDKDCSKELMRSLKKLGFTFHLKHMVTKVQSSKTKVKVDVQKRDSEDTFTLSADYCLVAIGRRPYTDGLGLENVDVEVDEKGRIQVDKHLRTKHPDIYAIGDVIKGAMLAHKAEEEGILVTEQLAGQKPHIDYNLIPNVVYTWPEVAGIGKTEDELKEAGVSYKVGKFPYKALGRARASTDVDGMVKILADKETDEVLGMHIVGARAADMIAEGVVAMEYRASAEDIARMSHAHPTYTEAIKEAALMATEDRALHI